MRQLTLLDLYCGAGGAAEGYRRAGFRVTGVDIAPQKNYPMQFIQADALEYVSEHGRDYDAIHASPPCQAYSIASRTARDRGKVYPDLLDATRRALAAVCRPWVIENVPGSPMRPDLKLCGCIFGLELRRVRWFETSWHALPLLPSCHHPHPVVSVVGHGSPAWVREALGFTPTIKDCRAAMGIDWMTRDEMSLAIPPSYTEYVGKLLRLEIERQ